MADWHLIDDLLLIAHKNGASDLILRTDDRVRMRIHGQIVTIAPKKIPPQSRKMIKAMIEHTMRLMSNKIDIEREHSLDYHYSLENVAHFRMHIFHTRNNFGIVARIIPKAIPTFEDLKLPPITQAISALRNGLVLVAGATGSGKSTTLAAILQYVIKNRPAHVITMEDPIEFCYDSKYQGTVTQREIGRDVESYNQGLHDALREAPDLIMAGEARSPEVIQLSLTAAETGHLVMATVHATSAIGTLQRLTASFPLDQQKIIRDRLGENLRAIIVQKLLPKKNGKGRVAVFEIMIRTSVVKHFIFDPGRWSEIPKAMEDGHDLFGSQSFDQCLQQLVETEQVDYDEAINHAIYPEEFSMRMGRD
ncbi:MAG: PilT/PilU family type 4a pilus ATPase [Mariprofundaceae bacterium]|nr:PilT/PilU family type 4a pilus ATPase [Mariprofundaceae bacterium]